MNWQQETIAASLVAAIIAIVLIVCISGADAITATRLPDIAIALVGALAGTKIPK